MDTELKDGDKAPNFTLTETNGEEVSLKNFFGKNVVLYFYPKDNTPGCTTQACDFRDDYQLYEDKNTAIIGISKDSTESHKNFVDKHSLPFTLLSDPELTVCKLYGVWKEKVNFGKKYLGIERTTFLINREGFIKKIYRRVRVRGHSGRVLDTI